MQKTNNYMNYTLSLTKLNSIYLANDICFLRVNLFCDFSLSLFDLIIDTYMGDDLTNDEQKLNHFKWCWEQTVRNFAKENITFHQHDLLYKYYLNFIQQVYYSEKDKSNNTNIKDSINKLWFYIFNCNIAKTQSDVDIFIEIYSMFSESLEKR